MKEKWGVEYTRGQKILICPPRRQQYEAEVLHASGEWINPIGAKWTAYAVPEDRLIVRKVYDHYVSPSRRMTEDVHKFWCYLL